MKYLIAILLVSGCAEEFDFEAYQDASCIGGADYVVTIDSDFDPEDLEVFAGAIDHINDSIGIIVQACPLGSVWNDSAKRIYVRMCEDDAKKSKVGYYHDGFVDIFVDGPIVSDAHMRKVFLHEMGHAFGAGHSPEKSDVMCVGWHGVDSYSQSNIETIRGLLCSE